jgi:hypothetical protein|tara:strand:- start:632 stop:1306 length:675 start_codon:yes stop_codon:yes gene_type:complete
MAYVRKTETLIDDVVRRIRNMAAKALGVYESKSIEIDTAEYAAACEAIHTAAYRDAPQLRGNLPESWLFKTERINLRIKDHSGNTIARAGLDAPEHRKFEVPAHKAKANSWSVDVDVYADECTGALAMWVQAHTTKTEQRSTIETQYREVERQVIGFLRTHASLNAAIKEMPEIELYVPDQYLRKMHEAVAPRVKKEEQQSAITELGIDRNALAAVAIAHRVMS